MTDETFRSGQSAQRPSEQNDDGFSTVAKEGKIQIAGVFDLAAKLAKLICHRVVINPESLLVILPVGPESRLGPLSSTKQEVFGEANAVTNGPSQMPPRIPTPLRARRVVPKTLRFMGKSML